MRHLKKIIPRPLKASLKRFLIRKSLTVSQVGQDFWVYAEVFNEMRGGYFVDVGAHDGFYLSNTFLLESRYGWKGICIEANPKTFRTLVANRSCTCLDTCVDSNEGCVKFAMRDVMGGIISNETDNQIASEESGAAVTSIKTKSLLTILRENKSPKTIDYLSIDVEGAEDRVLLNFDFAEYRFRCMTIERPSIALQKRLQDHGYLKIKEIPGLDFFYIHSEETNSHLQNLVSFYSKIQTTVRWS